PGSIPATSQLDWLISTTAMIVLSWSRATRDLLKSFGWGIRALHQLATATMVPFPRRLPHTISLLEGDGFELPVPRQRRHPSPTAGGSRKPPQPVATSERSSLRATLMMALSVPSFRGR